MKRKLIAALAILSTVALASPVRAQEKCVNQQLARQEFQKGYEFYSKEKYPEAIVHFTNAHRACPAPVNLYNVAKSYQKLGGRKNYRNAIKFYKGYLQSYQDKHKKIPPDFKDINATIKQLQFSIVQLYPLVIIRSTPKGATVYIDNKDTVRGTTPYQTNLRPGNHTLYLEKPGYERYKTEFEVLERKNLTLEFSLVQSQNVGFIAFNVNVKGARIYLDGKTIGITPFRDKYQVNAGKHQVIIEKDKYNTLNDSVDVEKGQNVARSYTMVLTSTPRSWRGYLGWSFVGIGIVGIGTGVLFKFLGDKEFSDTSKFKLYKKLTITGYAVGGTLIGAGIGFVIWEYMRKAVNEKDLVYVPRLNIGPDRSGRVSFSADWNFRF